MKVLRDTCIKVLFFLLMHCGIQAAPVTKLLPYDGPIALTNVAVLTNGVHLVRFQIFQAATGGKPVWEGEEHRLMVQEGSVQVILGKERSLASVDFNQSLFLEITPNVSGPGGVPDERISSMDLPTLPRQALGLTVLAENSPSANPTSRELKELLMRQKRMEDRIRDLETKIAPMASGADSPLRKLTDRVTSLEDKTSPLLKTPEGHLGISHGDHITLFQADGNICYYPKGGNVEWGLRDQMLQMRLLQAKTQFWHENGRLLQYTPREYMVWQVDGNAVIVRNGTNAVWSSGTVHPSDPR